jgi:hypothetical protein
MFPQKDIILRQCATIVLLSALAACGSGVVDPSQNKTETFSGTVNMGAGNVSTPLITFNVSKTGEYTIKVTNMTPTIPSNQYFEVAYGQAVSGQCAGNFGANTLAVLGGIALSGSIVPGSYCVAVVDEGFFTANETFTLTVSHP